MAPSLILALALGFAPAVCPPGDACTDVAPAVGIEREAGSPAARSVRATIPRRVVRKRDLLRPIFRARIVDVHDRTLRLLADALDRSATAWRRARRRAPREPGTELRLAVAGRASAQLHLPPPSDLL